MEDLYIAVMFNGDTNRKNLRCAAVRLGDKNMFFDLYRSGSERTIKQIKSDTKTIKEIILKASDSGRRVICQDFRDLLEHFDLPLDFRFYNVYDQHLNRIQNNGSIREDKTLIFEVLDHLSNCHVLEYQKLLSNSSVAYTSLNRQGIMYNYVRTFPVWSQRTTTGRSKTSGFNIQGLSTEDIVGSAFSTDKDLLILFDWICADIRVASIMSGDSVLMASFIDSDPYTRLMEILNENSNKKGLETVFDREEAKLALLRSINALEYNSVVFTDAFPRLGDWVYKMSQKQTMSTILGRKFDVDDRSRLSAFNAIMQGSVAHAMQNVMRRLWEKVGTRIVCDIHDSVVISCPKDPIELKNMIKIVSEVMIRPFEGYLDEDYVFPLKVSVGTKWRQYNHYKNIYRV